jgi:hypothetical protein
VLFCQLTDYQREIYQDFLRSKEVEEMLAGQRQVDMHSFLLNIHKKWGSEKVFVFFLSRCLLV